MRQALGPDPKCPGEPDSAGDSTTVALLLRTVGADGFDSVVTATRHRIGTEKCEWIS